MTSIFVSILLFSTLLFISCGHDSFELNAAPAVTMDTDKWVLTSVYEMPRGEGDLTYGFAFTADHHLWSRGSSDSNANQLMYSDDLGKKWKFVNLPPPGLGADGMITFADLEHGWAMDTSVLMNTENGGIAWKKVKLPSASKLVTLNAIKFNDENHGFVAGSTSHLLEKGLGTISRGMEILCTSDGGRRWSVCYSSGTNDTTLKMISLRQSTLALVDQRTLLITNNAGITWRDEHLLFAATDLEATPDGIIWATGEDGVLRSSGDLGHIWKTIAISGSYKTSDTKWISLSFDANGCGATVGSHGAVAFSTDQGHTWRLLTDLNLHSDLWIVRVQKPYVAITDKTKMYIFNGKSGEES